MAFLLAHFILPSHTISAVSRKDDLLDFYRHYSLYGARTSAEVYIFCLSTFSLLSSSYRQHIPVPSQRLPAIGTDAVEP